MLTCATTTKTRLRLHYIRNSKSAWLLRTHLTWGFYKHAHTHTHTHTHFLYIHSLAPGLFCLISNYLPFCRKGLFIHRVITWSTKFKFFFLFVFFFFMKLDFSERLGYFTCKCGIGFSISVRCKEKSCVKGYNVYGWLICVKIRHYYASPQSSSAATWVT